MPIDPELIKILRCPKCKGPLEHEQEPEGFICQSCKLRFPVVENVPNFIIEDAQPIT